MQKLHVTIPKNVKGFIEREIQPISPEIAPLPERMKVTEHRCVATYSETLIRRGNGGNFPLKMRGGMKSCQICWTRCEERETGGFSEVRPTT